MFYSGDITEDEMRIAEEKLQRFVDRANDQAAGIVHQKTDQILERG